jgi:hypothetical protein
VSKPITLDFSKFFPGDHSFVAVKARATYGDDFFVTLAFGDGDNKVTYFIDEYNMRDSLKQMNTMMEMLDKTMEFLHKASGMPEMPNRPTTGSFFNIPEESKPATKAAPKKKKAAAKK